MEDALAIDCVKGKGDGYLYLCKPGSKPQLFRQHFYNVQMCCYRSGHFFSEDIICLENAEQGKVARDDPANLSGYAYFPFFLYHEEICQLLDLATRGSQSFFTQLTRRGRNVLPRLEGFELPHRSQSAAVSEDNALYTAEGGNISRTETRYSKGLIKKRKTSNIGSRPGPTLLETIDGKVYDFTDNSVYKTDKGIELFRHDSTILSVCGIDAVLCSTEAGEVFDVMSGKLLADGPKPCRLVRYQGQVLVYDQDSIRTLDGGKLVDAKEDRLEGCIMRAWPASPDRT